MATKPFVVAAFAAVQAAANAGAAMSFDEVANDEAKKNKSGRKKGAKTIKRERPDMDDYLGDIHPALFKRMYRMEKKSFWILLDIIGPHLPNTGVKRKFGSVPNGPITESTRLSMALRYFAGGDPLDIAQNHNVGCGEILKRGNQCR